MRTIDDRTGLELLDETECLLLLGRTNLGRLAAVVDGRPVVFPVNFRRDGKSVVFRTDEGTKLDAAVQNAPVAFEVDEVDPQYRSGWSVVVSGRAAGIVDSEELEEAQHLSLHPWAVGVKSRYVRITPEQITGRRIVRLADAVYRR